MNDKIKEFETKLAEMQKELDALKNPKKPWEPEIGGKFLAINSIGV